MWHRDRKWANAAGKCCNRSAHCRVASSAQLLSRIQLCAPMDCSTPGLPVHRQLQSLPKLMSIESVKASHHLILCRLLLLPPSIFPSIRSFPMCQFFASGGQSIGVSASASVLPMNIQDWFPLRWTGWISLLSKGLSTTLDAYKDILLPMGLVSPNLGLVRFKSHQEIPSDL